MATEKLMPGVKGTITDKTSKFKGESATIKKVGKKNLTVELEENGIMRNAQVKIKGFAPEEKYVEKSSHQQAVISAVEEIKSAIKNGNPAIQKLYNENENINSHTENVLLMAHVVGEKGAIDEAEELLRQHNRDGDANGIYARRTALVHKIGDKFYELVYGKKMERGGIIIKQSEYAIEDVVEFEYGREKEKKHGVIIDRTKNGNYTISTGLSEIAVSPKNILGKVTEEKRKKVFGIFEDGGNIENVQKQIEELDAQITALEEQRDALQETITKHKAKELLDDAEKQGGAFLPWQKALTEEEMEFLIQAVNRYGSGEHPKATQENWKNFKYEFVKGILNSVEKSGHLTGDGDSLLLSIRKKMGLL